MLEYLSAEQQDRPHSSDPSGIPKYEIIFYDIQIVHFYSG